MTENKQQQPILIASFSAVSVSSAVATVIDTDNSSSRSRAALHFCASQNHVCTGIVARAALFSIGGWNVFPKTPTASHPVICFRVERHLGAEPTSRGSADYHTAKDLSSPCGGRCS